MKPPHEGDLAWDLVDDHGDALTQAERDMAFVNLGVGDYTTVIRDVLSAVMRTRESLSAETLSAETLSAETKAKVEAWIDCYAQHAALRPVLDGRAGGARPGGEDRAGGVSSG